MKNLVLIGKNSRAKSALIDALVTPRYGFRTRKYPLDTEGWCPIYLNGFSAPPLCTQAQLVGRCKDRHAERHPGAFDRIGVPLLTDIPAGSVVVLDELGFLEQDDLLFQQAVLSLLDGDYHVIISMKDKELPFLNQVKTHPDSLCVPFCEAQSETLLRELPLDFPWIYSLLQNNNSIL